MLFINLKKLLENRVNKSKNNRGENNSYSVEVERVSCQKIPTSQSEVSSNVFSLLSEQTVAFISGHFLKKIIVQGFCKSCLQYLHCNDQGDVYAWIEAK